MPIAVSGLNIVFADGSSIASGFTGFKNRVINGAMAIDQRNAGAAITSSGFVVDRWQIASNASDFTSNQSTTVPTGQGFRYSIYVKPTATKTPGAGTYAGVVSNIEGFNAADLMWGTSAAKTITVSFWVRSTKTGSYSFGTKNADASRSYSASYIINASNTWEYKTITISGDTTGTWNSTNGRGLTVDFWLAGNNVQTSSINTWIAGNSNMNTDQVNFFDSTSNEFYITGVQLEVGTQATSFEYRDYGNELRMCQRYLPVWYGGGDQIVTMYNSDTGILGSFKTPVPVRSTVTGLTFSTNANSIFSAYDGFKGGYTPTNAGLNNGGINYVTIQCNSTGLVAGRAGLLRVADSQWMYGTGCEL